MPLETDEHGNPKNLDFATLAKHLHAEAQHNTQTSHDSASALTHIPTPKEIFRQASRSILHQPYALSQLSTVFFYHLQKQQSCGNKTIREHEHFDEMKKAFGFDENFLKKLDSMNEQETQTFLELKQTDKEAAKTYIKNYPVKPTAHTMSAPIFLTGKTGSGKTHMIKELCKMFDVNFIAVNAASISNAGYKGVTLADIGTSLLQSAGNNSTRAEHSVVFFDEFDKLFISAGEQIGAYHLSLVTEILTIIEGTTPFPVKDDRGIDSHNMLFILGGSFNIHQKNEHSPIGFTHQKTLQGTPDSQLKLTDFGLPDELAGRIGKIITLQDISEEQMIEILLQSPTSPFTAFKNQLAMVNCTAEIKADALKHMAKQHADSIQKFGVRGLYQAFHSLPQISQILYEAPEKPHSRYIISTHNYIRIQNSVPKPKKPVPQKPPAPPPAPKVEKVENIEFDDLPF